MDANIRTASSVFPTPIGKRARTEITKFNINQFPADILRIFFKYAFVDESRFGIGKLVCRHWRNLLNDGRTLRLLSPFIGCHGYGARIPLSRLVDLANRYLSETTPSVRKFDLSYVQSINDTDLKRLDVSIESLIVKDCKISTEQLVILMSKLVKKNAKLKIALPNTDPDSKIISAAFTALIRNQVQLRSLKIDYKGEKPKVLFDTKNAFIWFVHDGGFSTESCKLSLRVDWFDPDHLNCFVQKGIKFSSFKLFLNGNNTVFANPEALARNLHEGFVTCIGKGMLAERCDFRYVPCRAGHDPVMAALLAKGIKIKHFKAFDDETDLLPHHGNMEESQREAFFNSGLTSPCSLNLRAADLANVSQIINQQIGVKTLFVEAGVEVQDEQNAFTRNICALIADAKWEDGCSIALVEESLNAEILTALAEHPTMRLNSFRILHGMEAWDTELDGDFFDNFLERLAQRQTSVENFEIESEIKSLVCQLTIDKIADVGRRYGFKFYQFGLRNYFHNEPLAILPLVKSGALDNCRRLSLEFPMADLIEALHELVDSNVRYLKIRVEEGKHDALVQFFDTHRFRCLIDLSVIVVSQFETYEDNKIAERYFERLRVGKKT